MMTHNHRAKSLAVDQSYFFGGVEGNRGPFPSVWLVFRSSLALKLDSTYHHLGNRFPC